MNWRERYGFWYRRAAEPVSIRRAGPGRRTDMADLSRRARILVIEDDPIIALTLRAWFAET